MYLRITHTHMEPAQSAEVARLVPTIRVAIQQLPGCQSTQVAIDHAIGESIAVSTFETREQAGLSRDSIREVLAPILALGWQAEPPEIYEIVQ